MPSIAHVGYGYWGRNLARNFSRIGALVAVVDANVQAAEEAAATYGVQTLSFDDALAAKEIDAISIASPAELHYSLARSALERGKHVFVEKPLALDVAEAEHLSELADSRGLTLMVGHLLHYHPIYVRLAQMVRDGELGNLRYAYSNRLSLGKFRIEENVLWSFAPHDISMLLGLFDEDPISVSAQGSIAFTPNVADFVTAQMKFRNGAGAHIQVSWLHPFKEQKLVVIGQKAMAVFEDSEPNWDRKLLVYDHVIDTAGRVPTPTKADARPIIVPHGEPLLEECKHFIRSIENGTEPRTGAREGLRVLRTLSLAEDKLRENLGIKDLRPAMLNSLRNDRENS
ncbi:Gfo/Idh/MocA family protein [Mesorhizobium sp. NPDC059025]|uniref:Gfo/Idh/MocA family protein n=1 Tax=unclassified Mesorhizobium TaxID=325217 RepID=UPI0036CCFAC3